MNSTKLALSHPLVRNSASSRHGLQHVLLWLGYSVTATTQLEHLRRTNWEISRQ
jgi:hypothetical protein